MLYAQCFKITIDFDLTIIFLCHLLFSTSLKYHPSIKNPEAQCAKFNMIQYEREHEVVSGQVQVTRDGINIILCH
jgi:hypothetical protein